MTVVVRNLAKKRNLSARASRSPGQRIHSGLLDEYCGFFRATSIDHNNDPIFESNLASNENYQSTKRLLSIPDPPGGSIFINH